jgi:DNA-binding MltR family transcriptional regulator
MADHPILTPDFAAIIQQMKLHTDTATAVVLASRAEDWLGEAIKTKMRDDLSAKLKERLFQGYGPLSTFSAKIDFAYALSIIEADIYNDFRAIKDIRNKFAHAQNVVHFQSAELAPLIQKLTGWTKDSSPIDLFMERCKECVESCKPSIKLGVLVKAVKEFKSQPDALQDKSPEQHPHHPTAPGENGEAE